MTIVVTGAGSGGHITPTLAVAHELKRLQPQTRVVFIADSSDKLADVPSQDPNIDEVYKVSAGKLRRYHNSGMKELLDIPTHLKNFRDGFKVLKGILQCYRLLGRIKPDAVFVKGGYIGAPVGIAAAWRHIPYMTHDSDSVPSLANRIISKRASFHATGAPVEYYSYSTANTEMVGVPISSEYKVVNQKTKNDFKKQLNMDNFREILLITGGGQGAKVLNEAAKIIIPELLSSHRQLGVVHVVGRLNEKDMISYYENSLKEEDKSRVKILGFVSDLYKYSGAADIIITRAGATTLAEFSMQAKPLIVVPNPFLVGGHQLINAKVLSDKKAIIIVDEENVINNPESLKVAVGDLLDSVKSREDLSAEIHKFARTNSAERIAEILLSLKLDKVDKP